MAHLQAALDALEVKLDDDVMKRLDQIWPGPGPAPESYAW
jgi:aryl-alcohol dehydrogenase-like predicted oxidoreductase